MASSEIRFARLTDIDIDQIVSVLNEPRNARHLPLAGERFTRDTATDWVAAKDG